MSFVEREEDGPPGPVYPGPAGITQVTPTTIPAPANAAYAVLSANGTLTAERVLTAGTGIALADAGPNAALTLSVDQAVALGNNARVAVSKNSGAVVGTRRELNLIEGANITLTVTDDAGSEEVDITIAAAGGSGQPNIQFKDEGTDQGTAGGITTVDFTGAGVTASDAGAVLTVNIPGGAGEAFPVGSVFIAVVATNPGTLLGYGTWSAFGAGRVLVGLDSGDTDFDLVEETGGAKTHTLVTGEIPAHTHTQDAHNHTQNAHAHVERAPTTASGGAMRFGIDTNASGTVTAGISTESTTATNQAATATNQNAGGGGAHNNVQPYIVVYMWKRTA